jgi:casein kinase 1 epsilon
MVYLIKGTLPWQGYTVSTGETKENWILTQKLKHSVESICEGLPIEIINIMEYCQELEYYEEPDYFYITSELRDMYIRLGYVLDYAYDWMLLPQETKYRSGTTTVRI